MAAPFQEGDILAGKYRVERIIGEGGMGVVVAAIHQQLDQRVALKFLLPEGLKDELVVGRFLREARAAVRLRSEHVARVLDVGTSDNGSPYIVMEYLDGQDLSNVIGKKGPLSVRAAATYILQAAEAIAEAHALGIVHRDLKPANLFLTARPDGSPCVKVLDFGISKVGSSDKNLTKTRGVLGTPFYMSPEQLRSSKDVDVRSDIWAIGMILYEMLTGTVAFDRDTLAELCVAILNDPLPPPQAKRPDLPPELCAVIERALAKSPDDRYQNLAELAADLAPFSPVGPSSYQSILRLLETRSKRTVAINESLPSVPPAAVPAPVPSSRRSLTNTPVERDAVVETDRVEPPGLSSAVLVAIGAALFAMVAIGVTLIVLRFGGSAKKGVTPTTAAPAVATSNPPSLSEPDPPIAVEPAAAAPSPAPATSVTSETRAPGPKPGAARVSPRPSASASAQPAPATPGDGELYGPRK